MSENWSLFTDLILISTPYLPCRQQVCSFHLRAQFCENSAVSFVMKYSPTSTVVQMNLRLLARCTFHDRPLNLCEL